MLPDDLLKTAKTLAEFGSSRPRDADLRRSVSTIYYAMFHTLAKCCADSLVGTTSTRSNEAWHQVYRALEHNLAKNSCDNKDIIKKFPNEIQDFAGLFKQMQEKRHLADYDPDEKFFKSAILVDISLVESAIREFKRTKIKDKRAFAVFVLLKKRKA